MEQDKQIHKLLEKISDLESFKEKQAIKITKLRDEMDSVNKEVKTTRNSSDTAVQSLSQELRHLKIDLEKSQSREKSVFARTTFIRVLEKRPLKQSISPEKKLLRIISFFFKSKKSFTTKI